MSTFTDISKTVALSGPAPFHTAAVFVQSREQGEALGSTTQCPVDEAAPERKLFLWVRGAGKLSPRSSLNDQLA